MDAPLELRVADAIGDRPANRIESYRRLRQAGFDSLNDRQLETLIILAGDAGLIEGSGNPFPQPGERQIRRVPGAQYIPPEDRLNGPTKCETPKVGMISRSGQLTEMEPQQVPEYMAEQRAERERLRLASLRQDIEAINATGPGFRSPFPGPVADPGGH